MSGDELLDMDYFLNEDDLFDDEAGVEGFYIFEYKTLFSFFVKDGREGQVMFRKKQKLYICKKRKIRNGYTHQGVLQGRLKLTCGTPFLLV